MSGVTCPWSAVAPLPAEGTWLLEASAGTGKTWQLASLVARLVVEPARADGSGLAIGRLLLMTFTRAAAAELRERVQNAVGGAVPGGNRRTRLEGGEMGAYKRWREQDVL